ncbi:MAG: SLOG family protein [Clostridia bacterium]|nr:SLOG family protein [Clostridia bacterium]
MYKTCAFSGHRNLKGYDFDSALMDRVILNLIKNGTENFLCGMALGFDMAAAESVIEFKKKYNIKLTAVLPCEDQSESFSQANKIRYERILRCCDEVITLSKEYYKGCMHARDRYMVENCQALVCFLRKNSGGTYYTVNYAKKLNIPLIEL